VSFLSLRRTRCVLSFIVITYFSAFSSLASAEWFREEASVMGTSVSVELWADNQAQANTVIALAMAELRWVDNTMSPYIETSELYRINQLAAKQPVVISKDLFQLIEKAQYFSKESNGAFDISFSSVGHFYDYRAGVKPNQQQLEQNLAAINYRLIKLDAANSTIYFQHPNIKIDLGGIAKGYAVDRAIAVLEKNNIVSAIVAAGGDSRIIGDRFGDPWVIGVRHPRQENAYAVKIPLENTAISTSGDYERFFIKNGERVHHILNPVTGLPANKVQSASILSAKAVDTDALSTTVFVLGVEQGLALVNRLKGVDAIIIDGQGKLHYSDELLLAE
jgi:thiamine biosynthesis lipoprotein